jgi:hypothetical protein
MPFAPYVREDQIVRTYHVLDTDNLPPVEDRNRTAVVSGAFTHDVYPLRTKCFQWARQGLLGPGVDAVPHPGYAQAGTKSNEYAAMFGKYKVAICTASSYRFALRKIFESTAMGCRVITDLPAYDCLPGIDANLIRVPPTISADGLRDVIQRAADRWNLYEQRKIADMCRRLCDWRNEYANVSRHLHLHWERKCRPTT